MQGGSYMLNFEKGDKTQCKNWHGGALFIMTYQILYLHYIEEIDK